MATRCSSHAWKTPRAEWSGGLQSLRSQRAGHDWVHTHTASVWILEGHNAAYNGGSGQPWGRELSEQKPNKGASHRDRDSHRGKSAPRRGTAVRRPEPGRRGRGGPEPGGRRGRHLLRQGPAVREPGGMARTELSSECWRKSEDCFERGRGIISHMFLKDYFYIDNRFFCRLPRIHLERSYWSWNPETFPRTVEMQTSVVILQWFSSNSFLRRLKYQLRILGITGLLLRSLLPHPMMLHFWQEKYLVQFAYTEKGPFLEKKLVLVSGSVVIYL